MYHVFIRKKHFEIDSFAALLYFFLSEFEITHKILSLSTKVQSLYFIIDSARSNDVDRKVTLDSLTALKWHFLCPLCDELLNNAHVSSECLHRICSGCVGQLGSRRICPCCSVSTPTTFSIDKQFDEIVS